VAKQRNKEASTITERGREYLHTTNKKEIDMEIGDKVKCIDGSNHKVIEGREYIIYDIHTCGCGTVSLDVGIEDYLGCFCSCNAVVANDTHWFAAKSRFIKVVTKKEVQYVKMSIKIEEPIYN
jgi:hypothetical protein